ncbi:MAG: 3-phosphoserine/phosphohydroxythreonine transaminase [Acidimicrobiales bacterium]
MSRAHNFSAGPSALPVSVLAELAEALPELGGTGMSVLEMSHRSAPYEAVHNDTLERLRRLSAAPDEVDILLVQGGATLQFAMVPFNLLPADGTAAYAVTGAWARKARADAARIGGVHDAWVRPEGDPLRMPHRGELDVPAGTAYLHTTSNETIEGVRYPDLSVLAGVADTVVADMSSDIFTRPIDWDAVDLVYAGSQKNLGPAGVTVVWIRRDLLDRVPDSVPSYLRYRTHADGHSLANTPPVFAIWAMGRTLAWIEDNGGIEAMESRAVKRSGRVYEVIDASGGFYASPVLAEHRSLTNIVFRLPDGDTEAAFLAGAEAEGMSNLKGHRSVGGIRASIYNALADESVDALVSYMERFAGEH